MMRRTLLTGMLAGGLSTFAAQSVRPVLAESAMGTDGPVVMTKAGAVRGVLHNGVASFKGIPFAAPPVGPARLRPPQPRAPWDGTLDASAFGPKPPQAAYPPMVADLIPPEETPAGDDCLTLNIWTPEPGRAGLPVMVWIPGGLFEYHATGASPWYDGTRFAEDGVVLVSINYRIGAEGFLYLGDGTANVGLLDQLAALRWVQDNISAFGGDPAKVTIFGESAGGLSVGTLLGMPRSKGLFARAIIESGGAQHVTSADTAGRIGRRLAEKLGVAASRDAISEVPIEDIIKAQDALRGELLVQPDPSFWGEVLLNGLPWEPVVDVDVIPQPPLAAIATGSSADVDLLAGSNTEEWRLFMVPGAAIDQVPMAMVAGTLAACGLPPEAGLAAYQAMLPDAGPGDLFSAVMTDWYWRVPALRVAEAHATAAGRTHVYEFGWRSPAFAGRLGAGHALEIGFVFDTLGRVTPRLYGDAPPQALADTMHKAWVDFAATGDPGWPRFDLSTRSTMHFDTVSAVVEDPMKTVRTLWAGVR